MTNSNSRNSMTKVLIAAGLVLTLQGLGIESALADAQDDARSLLAHGGAVSPPQVKGSSHPLSAFPDPQEQARRLLARTPGGVSVSGEPLVMRVDKDEFRIAFRVEDKGGLPAIRSGSVRYRIEWRTGDGATHTDLRQVRYSLPADATRTIAVDRQYLDTAEGENTVEVVKVSVDAVSVD